MHGTFKAIEVKVDPLTLESLIAWLEQQPARKRYDYDDCSGKCLYGQYMASHGICWDESGASYGSKTDRGRFCNLVYAVVANSRPWTFGAALKRARIALTS